MAQLLNKAPLKGLDRREYTYAKPALNTAQVREPCSRLNLIKILKID